MPIYCVKPKGDDAAEAFWVQAFTATEARRLVALNAKGASEAEDPDKFDCVQDRTKTPPHGMIYRRLHGEDAITKR